MKKKLKTKFGKNIFKNQFEERLKKTKENEF